MPKGEFVVKLNDTTDLFLTVYSTSPELCQWGSVEEAIILPTLEQAQSLALSIGGGTIGLPKTH